MTKREYKCSEYYNEEAEDRHINKKYEQLLERCILMVEGRDNIIKRQIKEEIEFKAIIKYLKKNN